ncbi:hypothetical protein C8R43DRAFT_983162 [Mycena crocata]|nr:hypothetical protein C8R43DRAFT_983162 [Mycena crocata]
MSIYPPLNLGLKIARTLHARPGQLVYCKDGNNITACFYELLMSRGHILSPEEYSYIRLVQAAHPVTLGRPCIILDRRPDGQYIVCFIAQIRGQEFSPIGRFFGLPVGSREYSNVHQPDLSSSTSPTSSSPFIPLRIADTARNQGRAKSRFSLFALPVVRQRIHLPPCEPRHLVDGDLTRGVELVRERVLACDQVHTSLRREQLSWRERTPFWRWKNPQEGGVDIWTHLRI